MVGKLARLHPRHRGSNDSTLCTLSTSLPLSDLRLPLNSPCVEDASELLILLPLHLEYWDYSCVFQYSFYMQPGVEFRLYARLALYLLNDILSS